MKGQIVFPSLIRLPEGDAEAIPSRVEPDLDTVVDPFYPACRLSGVPRYQLNGTERPDIDPTIPDDLADWHWHGAYLSQFDPAQPNICRITIAFRLSLADLWKSARRLNQIRDEIAAQRLVEAAAAPSKAKRMAAPVSAPVPEQIKSEAAPAPVQLALL